MTIRIAACEQGCEQGRDTQGRDTQGGSEQGGDKPGPYHIRDAVPYMVGAGLVPALLAPALRVITLLLFYPFSCPDWISK